MSAENGMMQEDILYKRDAVSILRRTKTLISSPDRWTKGAPARSSGDGLRYSRDHDATKWCLMGAIWKVASTAEEFHLARQALERHSPMRTLADFNDALETSYSDVLALIDLTIKEEKKGIAT